VAEKKKMAQQLLSVGLALSKQGLETDREVAGDKGQWGFVLQGMRPAAEVRSSGGQRKVTRGSSVSFKLRASYCKAGTLLLEVYLQTFLLWLF
jgi:hypothetical protein